MSLLPSFPPSLPDPLVEVPPFPSSRPVFGGVSSTLHGSLVVVCGGYWAEAGSVARRCLGWDASGGGGSGSTGGDQ